MPMGWQQQEPAGAFNTYIHFRTGTDATMDGHTPEIQHDLLVTEKHANQTGNHEPRNHPIRVPTAPVSRAGGERGRRHALAQRQRLRRAMRGVCARKGHEAFLRLCRQKTSVSGQPSSLDALRGAGFSQGLGLSP